MLDPFGSSCGLFLLEMNSELTYVKANELFRYDQSSGKLFWRVGRGGREAGWEQRHHKTSYRRVVVDGRQYGVHRIVWMLNTGKWPSFHIDHRDGNGINNRMNNLRDVENGENQKNRRRQKNNTSGLTGINWNAEKAMWQARVGVRGARRHVGYYKSIGDAKDALLAARRTLGYDELHGSQR